MPPEINPKNNIPSSDPIKVGIDPVFKGNMNTQNGSISQSSPLTAYNALNNQQYVPNKPINVAPVTPIVNNNTPKSLVRTFKSDMESAIQADHLSSINIAIAENQKMNKQIRTEQAVEALEQGANPTSNYSINKIIIFISLLLVIGGIAGISIVYFINRPSSNPVAQVQELPSLITTEFKDELNAGSVNKDKFVDALGSRLNTAQITVNNLYNTYVTTGTSTSRRLVTSAEFISLSKFQIPDMVKRTLLPDFMVGMFLFEKNLPFVIFKTTSFENTYAGMLTWESYMEKDFKVLFRLPGYETSQGIMAELTPTTAKRFEDKVIVNKDVRVLKGVNGDIILLYGIVDKETIIITVSETAFKEIVNRLNKEKSLKR